MKSSSIPHPFYFPLGSCAYPSCQGHYRHPSFNPKLSPIVRKGTFYRSSDSREIRRFLCRLCKRTFSNATRSECFLQKKRHLNSSVENLFCSGFSQRRMARILGLTQNTVARKLIFLGLRAKRRHQEFLKEYVLKNGLIQSIQFDEMETFERSKCLPVSIPLVVEEKTRKILSLKTASMPAKGLLSKISVKKYGPRADHRPQVAKELWSELRHYLVLHPKIKSDQNPKYPHWIKPHFEKVNHETVKGRRGCVVGQGELKRGGFDPLFALNHTAAMLRANVNRLFRRTWCTTKKRDRLELHLYLYANYHNRVLTKSI